jgi:hypothetical protein
LPKGGRGIKGVKCMECEKVRDKFSSLLEGELDTLEDKVLKEHLTSCSECRKDFEKFEKMVRWLHSVDEVEVPDGFLSEIQKKKEERTRLGFATGKAKPGWFGRLSPMKLPIQALAMVTIIFVVLYLTRMMPPEVIEPKVAKQEEVSQPEAKTEAKAVIKDSEKKEEGTSLPQETVRSKKLQQERAETPTPSLPKTEAPVAEVQPLKESERAERQPVEVDKEKRPVLAKEKALFAGKPPREIILKVSQREKVLSQIQELVKQSGGKIEKEEGNALLAFLPAASLPEFEARLAELSSPKQAARTVLQKDSTGEIGSPAEMKRRDATEKGKEGLIPIRILLVQD